MFKSLLLAATAVVCSQATGGDWEGEITRRNLDNMDLLQEFNNWALEFDRDYETIEIAAKRYKFWLDNMYKIADINGQDLTYKLKMNQFGDMTGDEFRQYVHGKDGRCFKKSETYKLWESAPITGNDEIDAPTTVDWEAKGVVTPVKNQGQCGSCWAFSATGAMECDYAIKTTTLNSLSEQQLVDCAGAKYGCYGCNGGQMSGGMEYAANEGGLCLESAYKYTARDGSCKASSCGKKYDGPSGKGYTPVTRDDYSAMQTATVAGCVSIGIEADQYAFQYYSSGVLTGTCGTSIDHGVLIVGYGTDKGTEYWQVKNSWGTSWGMKGYVLICRQCGKNGKAGECGILEEGNVPNY